MPYITFSKGASADSLSRKISNRIAELFDDKEVVKRGRKTVSKVVADATKKGFTKIVLIEQPSPKIVRVNVIRVLNHKGEYVWSARYEASVTGAGALRLRGNSNGAKKRFVEEAS